MEQAQTRAFAALQPFVQLAKSATSQSPRYISNIITNATSAPNTFTFAELLETPAIQSLASPDTPEEYRPYLTQLEIFAWGTWEEYHSTPNLPTLRDVQASKLRLLSLLTLSTTHNPLTYPTVMTSLSLDTHAALESLVTKAIYSSLIAARLSPTTTPPTINVTSIAPLRDVKPQTVDSMISILSEWQGRCKDVITGIEAEIALIKSDAEKKRAKEQDRAMRFERSLGGWNGDRDGGDGGDASGSTGGRGSGFGSKRIPRFSKDSGSGEGAGRRFGFGGGSGGAKGNKRDLNAAGHHAGILAGQQMEIDEGSWGVGYDGVNEVERRAKRPVGISA